MRRSSDGLGYARSYSFALWRESPQLAQKIRTAIAEAPRSQRLAVTMTGELADCFETKAEGVAFIPGSAFSPSGRFTDALRVCFASTPPDRIYEGVARLRRAVDVLAKG